MVAIVTRAGKGSPLTNAEVDANFTNLNNGKVETNFSAVVAALGYTPYNATNPSNFLDQAGVRAALSVTGDLTYNSTTGVFGVNVPVTSVFGRTGAVVLQSADVTTALGYTPPQPGGTGASGTWGIAITGNAGNASSISNAVGGAYIWTAANQFTGNGNTASAFGPGLQVFSTGGNGAVMGFHRGGAFGVNMGLDSDNVFRIGGWSASANRMQMDMSGNLTMSGNVQANSDERLKKDWELLPIDFLDRLAAVKSGTYTRIDSGARQAGVSAQAMREVLTEVVSADAEGTLSVAYGNVALVAAIELAKELITIRQKLAKIIDEE